MKKLIHICSGYSRAGAAPDRTEAILVNVPDVLRWKTSEKDILNLLKEHRPKLKVLDSGGAQVYRVMAGKSKTFKTFVSDKTKPVYFGKTLNLSPYHLKDAALKIHADIVMALDFPLQPEKNPKLKDKAYKDSIDMNVQWARESIMLRNEYFPNAQIFLPFQGFKLDHVDHFLNRISPLRFDGLSLPTRAFSTEEIIVFLMKFKESNIKKVHVLGSSRFDLLCILAYLTHHDYFDFLSFDSGTTAIEARLGRYCIPYDLRTCSVNDLNAMKKASTTSRCDCDLCRNKLHLDIARMPLKEQRRLLSEHNYRAIQVTKNDLCLHATRPASLKKFLLKVSERKDSIEQVYNILSGIENGKYNPCTQKIL